MKELATKYDPKDVEDRIYQTWLDGKYFHAEPDPKKNPYTIVIPPPNITGQLHMGHALDNTLQDILIRFRRMQGYDTLWLPGTDHASIATEAKIVAAMKEEGITKEEIGRDAFLERAWDWKAQYGGRIIEQLKKMGSSCDWDRERFTLDEGCSKAVREVFCNLYEKGLIYRGERIINWCTHCKTSISDAEVEYEEHDGNFWHLRYPLADGTGAIEVATTRPETIPGDTGVAVHPDDERYKHLIGKTVVIPVIGREIPIVADTYAKMDKGTGAVKITPAHDPNDFEVGLRCNLPVINVMTDDGFMNEKAGKYAGMDLKECRKAIVKDMEEAGALIKIEPTKHEVGSCYRCHTVVEPRVSKQWFVKMEPLAKPAIKAVRDGETKFIPERFDKIYFNWMENIRDWCISRQLWWGHRIPAWYCDECGEITVSREEPTKCCKCGSTHIKQDEDTLDTWFSSALWPFSTLGWPEKTPELAHYYPTSTLVTGYDIIFFWVARMIFSACEQMGEVPFGTVFIHGIVRDEQGRKMSKSLGNGIDPLIVIDKYGADALRMTLATGNSPGNDMRYSEKKVEASRNFANKIWNALRLVKGWEVSEELKQPEECSQAVEWIEQRMACVLEEVERDFDQYRLSEALMATYKLMWDDFCSWYLEIIKPAYQAPIDRETYEATIRIFERLMCMLHPFMPFVTEEVWHTLRERPEEASIMVQHMPMSVFFDQRMLDGFAKAQETIAGVRNIRNSKGLSPKEALELYIRENEADTRFDNIIKKVANVSKVEYVSEKVEGAISFMVGTAECFVPMSQNIDKEAELKKLQDELAYTEGFLNSVMKKLSNEKFVNGAPEKVVNIERQKKADAESKIAAIKAQIAMLNA